MPALVAKEIFGDPGYLGLPGAFCDGRPARVARHAMSFWGHGANVLQSGLIKVLVGTAGISGHTGYLG